MANAGENSPRTTKKQAKGAGWPTIVAFVVILALVGGFALLGSRTLVRTAGGGATAGGAPETPTVTGQPVEKATAVDGSVQRITVDPASGVYDPNVIVAKAGVPLEVTFKPGSGCLAAVSFPTFSIRQDIQSGAVVKLPALKAGEYPFSCGMKMVFGKIVVR